MPGKSDRPVAVPVRRSGRTSKSGLNDSGSSSTANERARNSVAGPSGYKSKRAPVFPAVDDVPSSARNELPVVSLTDINANKSVPASTPSESARQRTRKVDMFCWACHEVADNDEDSKVCIKCPRTYHIHCLGLVSHFSAEGICPECNQVSVDGSEASVAANNPRVLDLLPEIFQEMTEKWKMFLAWPNNSREKNDKICCIIDLDYIGDRLHLNAYNTTSAFLADVKWIHHNMYIVYGPRHVFTVKSKTLRNDCRNRLIDLESCAECFLALRNTRADSFTEICSNIHQLVWVKLRGHPYWPAKVLKVIDKKVSVIFFGSHERSKVSVADCYALSKENPGGKLPKKESYAVALEELELHIQNHVNEFGSFQYAEPKTPFDVPSSKKVTAKRQIMPTAGKRHRRKRMRTDDSPANGSGERSEEDAAPPSNAIPREPELIVLSDEEAATSTKNGANSEILDMDVSTSSIIAAFLPESGEHSLVIPGPPSAAEAAAATASIHEPPDDESSNDSVVMEFYAEKGVLDESPDYREELLINNEITAKANAIADIVDNVLEEVLGAEGENSDALMNPDEQAHGRPNQGLAPPDVRGDQNENEGIDDAQNPVASCSQNPGVSGVQNAVVHSDIQSLRGNRRRPFGRNVMDVCLRKIEIALTPMINQLCHEITMSPQREAYMRLRHECEERAKELFLLKQEKERIRRHADLLLRKLQGQICREVSKRIELEQSRVSITEQLGEAEHRIRELENQIEVMQRHMRERRATDHSRNIQVPQREITQGSNQRPANAECSTMTVECSSLINSPLRRSIGSQTDISCYNCDYNKVMKFVQNSASQLSLMVSSKQLSAAASRQLSALASKPFSAMASKELYEMLHQKTNEKAITTTTHVPGQSSTQTDLEASTQTEGEATILTEDKASASSTDGNTDNGGDGDSSRLPPAATQVQQMLRMKILDGCVLLKSREGNSEKTAGTEQTVARNREESLPPSSVYLQGEGSAVCEVESCSGSEEITDQEGGKKGGEPPCEPMEVKESASIAGEPSPDVQDAAANIEDHPIVVQAAAAASAEGDDDVGVVQAAAASTEDHEDVSDISSSVDPDHSP